MSAPEGDRPANAEAGDPQTLARAFLTYERYAARVTEPDGRTHTLQRDVVRIGKVVGVLCLDPARDAIVLIRQFRLSAHLAANAGDMVELPAGRVEPGEAPEAAAARECLEETGLAPLRLTRMFDVMSTPGVLDEYCTLFLAEIDASALPARAGLASESEVTHPFALKVDEALRLLDGGCLNGYLLLALQWLALRRQAGTAAPRLAMNDG